MSSPVCLQGGGEEKIEIFSKEHKTKEGNLKNEVEHILTRKVSNHENLQKVEQAKKKIFIREINDLETRKNTGVKPI